MVSRGGIGAGERGRPGTAAVADALATLARNDPDKALVMRYIGRLVTDGCAEWAMLGTGEVEVRFTSGETFSYP
ncbi:MAG: hypothetical protein U1E59_20830 [Amaricoccus sp.]